MRPAPVLVAVAGLLWAGGSSVRAADAAAAPPPVADADFLEYLGSWDGSDADWQVMAADRAAVRPAAGAQESKAKTAANASPVAAGDGAAHQEQQ
ncbi:MAG: hypothetical protein U1F08_01235 [Steroidobacteraceae bacterium]